MMSTKQFKWAGHNFTETVEHGQRSVVLRLHSGQEFTARSEMFLREEAAARILSSPEVRERMLRK